MNIADETIKGCSFLSRYHYTKSNNYLKDYIEFVTEFPCLFGHPVEVQYNHEIVTLKEFRVVFKCHFCGNPVHMVIWLFS